MQSNYKNSRMGLTSTPEYQRWLDEQGPYPDAEVSADDICSFCGEPLPPGTERDICYVCNQNARERDAAIREDLWHTHRKGGL